MMINSKSAKTSAMYIGYVILDGIKNVKKDKISIYEISTILKKKGITSSRQLVLGLSFLHAVDIIDFEEAHVWIKR